MPRKAPQIKKKPLTLGDVGKQISAIKATNLLYVALLVSVFTSGYLFSRVQTLEKTGGSTVAGTETQAQAETAQPKVSIDTVKEVFGKAFIKFGDTKKKVIAIEVADPSCPYCHIAGGHNPELNTQSGDQFKLVSDGGTYVAPVTELKKLLDEDKIAFAYVYYPGHANGDMATKALYCAHEQKKFWEAHDLLMNNAGYNLINNTVKNDTAQSQALVDFLSSTSLDLASLKECIDSGKYDKQLQADQELARQLQIQGTPGFYLNETSYPGAYSFKDMEATIKAAGL